LFNILDGYDMAFANNHNRKACKLDDIPNSFPEFNTGVILFKENRRVEELFSKWERIWNKKRIVTLMTSLRLEKQYTRVM